MLRCWNNTVPPLVPPTFCASFHYSPKRRDGADIQIEEREKSIQRGFMNDKWRLRSISP